MTERYQIVTDVEGVDHYHYVEAKNVKQLSHEDIVADGVRITFAGDITSVTVVNKPGEAHA